MEQHGWSCFLRETEKFDLNRAGVFVALDRDGAHNLIMIRYLVFLLGCVAQVCAASPSFGEKDGVHYVVSPNGTAFFDTRATEWDVVCAAGSCRAVSGPISVVLDQTGWHLETASQGAVFHWRARVRRAIPIQKPLNQLELQSLEAGGALQVAQQATRLDMTGFHVVALYMRTISGVLGQPVVADTLSHHKIAQDYQQSAVAQLVPFTKPQIEFAIRAQTSREDLQN